MITVMADITRPVTRVGGDLSGDFLGVRGPGKGDVDQSLGSKGSGVRQALAYTSAQLGGVGKVLIILKEPQFLPLYNGDAYLFHMVL